MTTAPSRPLPVLSIIVPVHNGEATLAEQLEALTSSIVAEMEIVIVDNRSTDLTRHIATEAAQRDRRIRVVDAAERPGEAYARNVGIAESRSSRLAFCDADDVVSSGWAQALHAALELHPFVTGPVELDRLNPPWLAGVRGRRIFNATPTTVGQIPFAHGCNMGMTRSLARQIGGFDESVRIGVDVAFAIRAHHAGFGLWWCPEAVVHYRHRNDSGQRWRQAVGYGRASAHIHDVAGFRWSLKKRLLAQARRVSWLIRSAPRVGRRDVRTQWMWTLALVWGETPGRER